MIDHFEHRRERTAERWSDRWGTWRDPVESGPEEFPRCFVVVDDREVLPGSVVRAIGRRTTVVTDCGLAVSVPHEDCFATEFEAAEYLRELAAGELAAAA